MKHSLNITILPAFGDNYIYLAEYAAGKCFVVDPGDANVAADEVDHQDSQLTHMLATHHHADHIGGIDTLKQQTGCKVIGPDAQRIRGIDTVVSQDDEIGLGTVTIRCIATPGHTTTSVCYYVTGDSLAQPALFTGDTLFVCGCGRMFECNGQTMYASLQKLTTLPDETLIYPGHDYTEENIRFALTFEPDNEALQNKLSEIQAILREQNPRGHSPSYTVPSTLAEEKRLNPFLKAPDWKTFAALRRKKDFF